MLVVDVNECRIYNGSAVSERSLIFSETVTVVWMFLKEKIYSNILAGINNAY